MEPDTHHVLDARAVRLARERPLRVREPGARDALAKLATWYQAGYMDKEFIVKDNYKALDDSWVKGEGFAAQVAWWMMGWKIAQTNQANPNATVINGPWLKGPSGRYAKRVRYTVFLRGRPGKKFVYYDQRGLRMDKKPKPSGAKHMPRGWVKVVFTTGDPAHGWT